MSRIIIEVDDRVAKAFQNANPERKKQVNDIINMWLKKAINDATSDDYKKTLDEMSDEAEKNGLTPEILEQLLKQDD